MRLKSLGTEPSEEKYTFLGEYLQEILGLSKEKMFNEHIAGISFDTRSGNPHNIPSKYNTDYHIALYEKLADTSKRFEDTYTIIDVVETDPQIIPYLNDSKHCVADSDCTVRTDFCRYGGFNYYHSYADTWGCGSFQDDTGYEKTYDDTLGCPTKITYGGVKCISNQCVGQDRVISCEEVE